MAKSQFEKRKAKEKQVTEPVEVPEVILPTVETKEFTHMGYDVYHNKETRQYEVAVFRYNPLTKVVQMDEPFTVSRSVALKYDLDKSAFKILIKRKKVQGV